MISLRTLGEIRIEGPGSELVAGRRKELVLLAYLARQAPRSIRRAELIGLFWPDRDEARARQSLRQALLRLRRVIGDDLAANPETVQLAAGAIAFDVSAFEADIAAARPEKALERWAGDFLPESEDAGGEAYRAWLDAERETLRRQLADAFEQLVETEAGRVVADSKSHLLPLDERVHCRWIKALHRDGRTDEALIRHSGFASRLRRELGVEPSTEFVLLGSMLERVAGLGKSSSLGSPGSIALFTPDLTGRDATLAALRDAWSAVENGEGAVVVVEGGEGMGKTLLCEEFLRELRGATRPSLILDARADPDEPASPWESACELLAGIATAPGLGGVADRSLAEVSRLVPAIRTRFARLPEAAGDHRALEDALLQVLATVAQELPITVFFDDLPYADDASRHFVLELASNATPGVLLLLTARPEWLLPRAALVDLCRASGVRRIKLDPLAVSDVDALLRSMLELAPDERHVLVERLHGETGGNPYHIAELVSTMVDEGRLVLDTRGFWRMPAAMSAQPLPLPISVRDAAERRFAILSERAQLLLCAAAELQGPFEPTADHVRVRLPPSEFEGALDELINHRLLRPAAAVPGALEFSSPLIRRTARDRLARARGRTDAVKVGARIRWAALIVLGAVPLLAAIALVVRGYAAGVTPVIAVGELSAHGAPDIADGAAATADMLATNLARIPGLRVVSSARMHELVAQLGGASSDAVRAGAARQAGATELIEGALLARAGGGMRLDLRRVDLQTGAVRAAYTVEGADPFELVDRATAELAADFNLSSRPLHLAEVTTSSFVAYRFYEEGLRSYAVADYRSALRLFQAALAEDSLFSMAAHYAGLSHIQLFQRIPAGLHERLVKVGDRVTDRERLLMKGTWETGTGGLHHAAVAETLAVRYPTEPDGHYMLAVARMSAGDFLGALPHLERVIAMDSLGLRGTQARCLACDALARTISAYRLADSLDAAERVARDWVRRQPNSALAWLNLAMTLEAEDRYEDALAARRTAASLNPIDKYDALFPGMVHIRAGDFAAADRLLRDLARSTNPEVQKEARWFLSISLRYQGRLREALAIVAAGAPKGADPFLTQQALLLMELGRAMEAARLFDSIAVSTIAPATPAVEARHKTFTLTQRADALAAAGQFSRLEALAGQIEMFGRDSRYGRDWKLHHHVRGLLLAGRGQREEAAAQFRTAMYSATSGYTRTNLELGRVLLELRRPRAAIAVLQPAFRGPLEASNLFVTRTELHELLGRAWEAAGQTDSAATHYQRVLNAWRNADPEFHSRRNAVQQRLSALRGR